MTAASRIANGKQFQKRLTGLLALLTLAWAVLLVVSEAIAGPAVTVREYAARFYDWPVLYTAVYTNAGALTVVTAAVMLLWLLRGDKICGTACVVAVVATVIYGAINCLVYFSQVFWVPGWARLYLGISAYTPSLLMKQDLSMWLHQYPGSTIALLNLVAYAALAIPSLVVGRWMLDEIGKVRAAGWCLIVSGGLSVLALAGVLAGISALGVLSLVSGAVFLIALVLRWVAY